MPIAYVDCLAGASGNMLLGALVDLGLPIEELKEKPAILIVLSKSDQDIRKTLQWQQNVTTIKNKFNKVVDEFTQFPIDFCDTTVFQRETIMQMFSIALKKVSDTSEIIENILEDFCAQVDAKASRSYPQFRYASASASSNFLYTDFS